MQVEDTGLDETGASGDKDRAIVEYIERRKVVMLEDVAAEFKMLAKDVVAKIEWLEKEGKLLGITDDRGKYIHVTQEEFQQIGSYIENCGRVNRSDLFREANKIVRMIPTEADKEIIKQEHLEVLNKVEKAIGSDKK